MNIVLILIVIALAGVAIWYSERRKTNVAIIAKIQADLDRGHNALAEAVHSEVAAIENTIIAAKSKIEKLLGTGAVHPETVVKLNSVADHVDSALAA